MRETQGEVVSSIEMLNNLPICLRNGAVANFSAVQLQDRVWGKVSCKNHGIKKWRVESQRMLKFLQQVRHWTSPVISSVQRALLSRALRQACSPATSTIKRNTLRENKLLKTEGDTHTQ